MSATATRRRRKPAAAAPRSETRHAILDDLTIREIDEDARTATFVAATEIGVRTWDGPQHLMMFGCKLDRWAKNPVILDSHQRFEVGRILGSGVASIEDRELVVTVTFANTARADDAWQLVQDGHLRSVSVGFFISKWTNVAEGETYAKKGRSIEGPAVVVEEWELYEISLVPVGADEDALRRAAVGDLMAGADSDAVQTIAAYLRKEHGMGDDNKKPGPQKPAVGEKPETQERSAPETPAPPEAKPPVSDAEREAREVAATADAIRALAGNDAVLRAEADQCVLENVSLADARKRLLEAHAARSKPAGTPEPPEPPAAGKPVDGQPRKLADVDDDTFARSFTG